MVVTSLLFSASHFLRRPDAPHELTWITGYETLLAMLGALARWDRLLPAFVTLFLLGALLGLSRHREGNVYFSVGLHAGIVMAAKMRGLFIQAREGAAEGGELMSGWLALVLSWVGWILFYLSWRDRSVAGVGQNRLSQ